MVHERERTDGDGERVRAPEKSDDGLLARLGQRDGDPVLSVVVPTKEEAENIGRLIQRLEQTAPNVPTEIIFVDDSNDGTAAAIEEIGARSSREVRLLHRPPHQRSDGLAGAVVEGLRIARAPWVCVMDADLQHPPELIPRLLDKADQSDADLVLASRYCAEGDSRGFGRLRAAVSQASTALARLLFGSGLRNVSDPLSGFFLVRKAAIDLDKLRPRGFKILLEIIVRSPALRVAEVPFQFGVRHAGESKASIREGLHYLSHLWRLRFGEGALRFGRFGLVGASGVLVNTLVLAFATDVVGLHYLLSAAVATQGSTLWNFSLSELWVFSDRRQKGRRLLRLALFLLMNNGALGLRGPLLLILTSGFGIHYVLSNLVSLGVLTLVRFALADTMIWGRAPRRKGQLAAHTYDIHGIVTVVSDVRLPELERFRISEALERPTIRVRIGELPAGRERPENGAQSDVRSLRYAEVLGTLGFGIHIEMGDTIDVVASRLLKRSPHVLYTNVVEPILRWRFVEEGYALVHGACVAFGGEAFLVTAKTDTGKTTTILRMLDRERCSFLSDDLTLVCPDGRLLMYPKPLTISRHTAAAVKSPLLSRRERLALLVQSRVHSRSGRLFAHLISRTRLPAATINTIAQMLIPPPKYDVDRLVPGVRVVREARLVGLAVIERGGEGIVHLRPEEAHEMLMQNCEDAYGFPPYHDIEGFLHSANGRNLRPAEAAIVAGALKLAPAILLRSKNMDWLPELLSFVENAKHVRFHDVPEQSAQAPLGASTYVEMSWDGPATS